MTKKRPIMCVTDDDNDNGDNCDGSGDDGNDGDDSNNNARPKQQKKKTTQRKMPKHTDVVSATVLNAMTVEKARTIYDSLASKAVRVGSCLFPSLLLQHGEYPRKTLNLDDLEGIDVERKKGQKIRVSYHQIGWRAMGNKLPDYTASVDIGHLCRRGQMQIPGPGTKKDKGSRNTADRQMGCFSMECLEQCLHRDNLDRGACDPIIQCEACAQYFSNCIHQKNGNQMCGSSRELEAGLEGQKTIEYITIKYTDGSSRTRWGNVTDQ